MRDVDLLRRRVLNVVGHELRTPVTTLSGLSAELERCTDDDRRRELLTAVARNAHRLERLLDDLLLAAGISTVVPVEDPAPVDLVAETRALWEGREADVSGAAVAFARPASVRRALGALVDNALGHGEPPFTVTASVDGDRAVLEIANGGPEVTIAELETAAELFFRGERAVTTQAGLGVGLSVAQTLLDADGGDLQLRPRDGGGVVARIELPRP
jgi:two-component system phosphate regulon sensor histidine kinase PhoR